jgi:nicotinamide mononucleotide (NMN) deamidase PncC
MLSNHQPSALKNSYRFLLLSLFLRAFALCWVHPNQPCMKQTFLRVNLRNRFFSSSRSMSFSESHKDYSLHGLEEYAERLISTNLDQAESTSRTSVCIAVAGGGGHAISTLAATPGASSIFLEGSVTYNRKSFHAYVGLPSNSTDIRYNSHKAAKLASEAALKRAMNFRSDNLTLMTGCVGVGCASALVSSSSPESVKGSGYIVATRADGCQLALNVSLAGKLATSDRTRREEDIFISHLVLRSIELIQQSEKGIYKTDDTTTDVGDCIVEEWGSSPEQDEEEDVAIAAANRILKGDEQAVVLLPMYKGGRPTSFRALKLPVIPNGSLFFPGSFNPPHKGHIALAKAAVRSAVNKGFSTRHDVKPIFMELSLTNADKPPIDPETVSERVHKFLELDDLPEQWGIILTRAPLFLQKVSSLQACVADTTVDITAGPVPDVSFVAGADTLVRIINPKYYNDDVDEMIDSLRSMKGVHFFGGGRLEQKKDSSEPVRFITGIEELKGLPEDVKEMFTIIEEKEFRVDMSSSEIRKEEEKHASTS